MSLAVVESYLNFADAVMASQADFPPGLDVNELESALVSFGIVLLHSHMEACLRKAVELRCQRCVDVEVLAFALSIKDEKTGKIGLEFLKATLKRFSAAYRTLFTQQLDALNIKDSWDSVVNQRHNVAHLGNRAALTRAELRSYYKDVRTILWLFCNVLNLSVQEVHSISPQIAPPAQPAIAPNPP